MHPFNAKNALFIGTLNVLLISPLCAATSSVGKSQTYGATSLEPGQVGTAFNPAAGAIVAARIPEGRHLMGEMAGGAGLQYGNVEELFEKIDSLADSIASDTQTGNSSGGNAGINLGSIDIANPQLEQLIDRVGQEVARVSSVLAIVASEGYARANLDGKISMVFAAQVLSGTFSFDYTSAVTAGFIGVTDPFDYDPNTALDNLQQAYNLQPGDLSTEFDLSGGVFLTVDPNLQRVEVTLVNDSLLFTRAMSMHEFALGYSREAMDLGSGRLYWGVTPKIMHAGLSNVAFRIGDITDSEAIFDDIRDRDFEYADEFSLDAGVIWVSDNYSFGASWQDIVEPEFTFPDVDTSTYQNPEMIARLADIRQYTMNSQLKLEGNYTSTGERWSINGAFDANAVDDILGFEYQWAVFSGGFHTGNWIVPDLRLGYHQNLAGSELSYIAGGMTLLKYFNLDFAMSLDDVNIEGDTLPRGVNMSLGFNYVF